MQQALAARCLERAATSARSRIAAAADSGPSHSRSASVRPPVAGLAR